MNIQKEKRQHFDKKWYWIHQLGQLGESPSKERATAAKRIKKEIGLKDPEIAADTDIRTMLAYLCCDETGSAPQTDRVNTNKHSVEWVAGNLSHSPESSLQELPIADDFDQSSWRPDWTNDSAYAHLENASLTQWAWEFLRRNPEYQVDYHKFSVYVGRPRAMVGESYYDYMNRMENEGKWSSPPSKLESEISLKYGISPRPCDPIINCPLDIFFGKSKVGIAPWIQFGDDYPTVPSDNHVSVVFDITQPLSEQIADAKLMLLELAPPKNIARNKRLHKSKFLAYLRILDAKELDTDLSAIADVLLPNIRNDYPDYNAEKQLRANLIRAKSIQEGEYNSFALRWIITNGRCEHLAPWYAMRPST
jgi:hypothetical protein